MDFKILLYLIGAIIYFVYRQYQKQQQEALKRKEHLEGETRSSPQPVIVATPKTTGGVKTQRQQLDAESAVARQQNKMYVPKTPKTFFDKPEHVTSVFAGRENIAQGVTQASVSENSETILRDDSEIRKMILYSELLKRPAW